MRGLDTGALKKSGNSEKEGVRPLDRRCERRRRGGGGLCSRAEPASPRLGLEEGRAGSSDATPNRALGR